MSKFPRWFTKAYTRWKKLRPGEEDFPAFCDLLGYPGTKVMSWLQGETEPQGPELLNIAGVCGTEVYSVLNQPEPKPELLKVYQSFPHLSWEDRSKVAIAIWEAQLELKEKGLNTTSTEAKEILKQGFDRWGFEAAGK